MFSKRIVRRIAPLPLGKIAALLYGTMGLILVPIRLGVAALAKHSPGPRRVGILALGTGLTLLFPLLYAAFGFICGGLGACIYNLVAKWIGGIEVEVE